MVTFKKYFSDFRKESLFLLNRQRFNKTYWTCDRLIDMFYPEIDIDGRIDKKCNILRRIYPDLMASDDDVRIYADVMRDLDYLREYRTMINKKIRIANDVRVAND